MKKADVLELAVDSLIPAWKVERARQQVFQDWAKGNHLLPYKPQEANAEYEALQEKAKVPLIGLVVRILAQATEMVDYTPGDAKLHDDLWAIWSANRMQARQKRLYRSAFTGGLAYTVSLPGDPVPVTKLFSAKNMVAVYQDPEADEWPMYGAYAEAADSSHWHFNVLDEESIYTLQIDVDGDNPKFIEEKAHGAGIPPIVRYTAEVDDEGEVEGEVERLIPIQGSIDQSKFDLLMTQTFASFKIRYATGMAKPKDDAEAAQVKLILAQDRILLSEDPESKFGTLDGTELSGYIEAGRASKQDLASVAQISQKAIVGAQANQSDGAEAQAAEEASTQRKLKDYETSFGESHSQWFRLNGELAGIDGAWTDYSGLPQWRDSEIRSLSQVADALGKMAAQLGIPKQALWEMIPNVGPEKIKMWKEMLKADPYGLMLESFNNEPDQSQ